MINTTVQHYRIIRALGRGGMGEVYAAEDTRLHRQVALKILPPGLAADSERLLRFQREAQAIAALSHPNVVTVYSVEQAGDLHFLTMELVDGRTLVELIPKGGLAFDEFLKFVVPLVDAVGAAHERGIVHRDLKPANIMVGADGRLKVLDFGLAKLRPEALAGDQKAAVTTAALTGERQVLGTAAYMSPEQAEGRPVDQRSDVFALGVVLYEMAAGKRPFGGDTPMSVISSILKDTPAPVTEWNSALPEGLDRILRRCLAKDPSRRYQSAIDLRNDLEELGQAARGGRRARARGVPLWTAGAAALACIVAAVAFLARGRSAAPRPATFTRITAMSGREWFPSLSPDGKWIVYGSEASGNFDIYLQSISGANAVNLTQDSPADDDMPAFSPDGERIAFRSNRDGGGIFVMGRTGEAVRRLTRGGFNPAWSPDGAEIAFTSGRMDVNPQNSEGKTELFVVSASGGEPRLVAAGDAIQPAWSPHKLRIAFASRLLNNNRRRADLWTVPVDGGLPTPVLEDPPYDWNPIWSPDGRHLYFVSDRGGTMNLWRLAIDEATGRAQGSPEPVLTPAPFCAHPTIAADGKHLAYSSVLLSANIQRLPLDESGAAVAGDVAWVTTGSRAWSDPDPSPDGANVVFYSSLEPIGDLYVSRADGTQLRQLTSDAALDRMPHWSPDGAWISMFSNRSGRLQLWKVRPDGSDLRQITDHPGAIAYSTWSPDGRQLIATTRDNTLLIVDANREWSNQTPATVPTFPDDPHEVRLSSWSADGRRIAGELGQTAAVKGVLIYTFATHAWERLTEFGEWPVWFPDSRRLLFGDGGKNFWVVDIQTREVKKIYSGGRDVLGPPRLTRDGRTAFYSRRISESDIWLMTVQ